MHSLISIIIFYITKLLFGWKANVIAGYQNVDWIVSHVHYLLYSFFPLSSQHVHPISYICNFFQLYCISQNVRCILCCLFFVLLAFFVVYSSCYLHSLLYILRVTCILCCPFSIDCPRHVHFCHAPPLSFCVMSVTFPDVTPLSITEYPMPSYCCLFFIVYPRFIKFAFSYSLSWNLSTASLYRFFLLLYFTFVMLHSSLCFYKEVEANCFLNLEVSAQFTQSRAVDGWYGWDQTRYLLPYFHISQSPVPPFAYQVQSSLSYQKKMRHLIHQT